MLSRALLPVALLVSLPVLAQEAAPAARPGRIEVPDFRGVEVGYGLTAQVKPGDKEVRLEGAAAEVAKLKPRVKDGVLSFEMEKSGWFEGGGPKGVRLYVTNPRVESIRASGGAHVEAEATAADTFEASASGGSHLSVSGVRSRKVETNASGGSKVTLQGGTSELGVNASGGSQLHAQGLQVESLQANASGGSRLEASPEQSIQGNLSGGSEIRSTRKGARVQVNSSGGSKVSAQ